MRMRVSWIEYGRFWSKVRREAKMGGSEAIGMTLEQDALIAHCLVEAASGAYMHSFQMSWR